MNDRISRVEHEAVGEHEHNLSFHFRKRVHPAGANARFNFRDIRWSLDDPEIYISGRESLDVSSLDNDALLGNR